ncbi:ABC transporter ATP-binding protein [Curvivirga aplysinae]|uniref:ABC transporter ATP-binding protein n=1 Tax=Curvivirga aplysinae TaxID=2529852 RepID=UPI0012BCA344|nr:ABC transporter ATP-binding protein [Curvivirga aplysinae]MTI08715.1 ABC transporter ATP-binding protein [Curvivirga aplysinae]
MTKFSIKNYSFSYGPTTILSEVNFDEIPRGKLVGLLGANGVGKSSFLRSIAGLETYTGSVKLDGSELQEQNMYKRMKLVGYMPQTLPQATSLTAYESVFSACRAVRPDLSHQEVEARLEDVFNTLGIRELAFKSLARMSGGQRQMVGLAQVIVKRPELLLLDEPTSALDLRWQMGVFNVVKNMLTNSEAICITALHDINLAMRHCDYIALFADGKLISFGLPTDAINEVNLNEAYGVSASIEISRAGYPFAIINGVTNE